MSSNTPYKLISSEKDFEQLINQLTQSKVIGVDLEFDKNRFRYGFNLCLLQVNCGDTNYLVDPLNSEVDLAKVWKVMEDPSIRKLTFEFGEDKRLLHSLGCNPCSIEDLSFGSKLLNYSQISLVNLIQELLGIETSKSSQTSNWFTRPLSSKQCIYAAEDVAYLGALREIIKEKLEQHQLISWYNAENAFFEKHVFQDQTTTSVTLNREDQERLTQVSYHILKELTDLQTELAKKHNRPAYQIVRKEFLLDFAVSEDAIRTFYDASGSLRSLKNESFKAQLIAYRKRSNAKALEAGLSSDLPAFPKPAKEELQRMKVNSKRVNQEVEQRWKPIQQVIKERWGEHTATFMLSNRLMKQMADNVYDQIPPYRLRLFSEIADEIGIDVLKNV